MGRSILFLILLFVFPLSACSHKSSAPVSADTMPDMEELLAYSQSHSQEEYEKKLKEIQAVIDNTSYEELCQIFTDSLASWADTQTDYEITDTSMKFSPAQDQSVPLQLPQSRGQHGVADTIQLAPQGIVADGPGVGDGAQDLHLPLAADEGHGVVQGTFLHTGAVIMGHGQFLLTCSALSALLRFGENVLSL